jgi:hypothetical protein
MDWLSALVEGAKDQFEEILLTLGDSSGDEEENEQGETEETNENDVTGVNRMTIKKERHNDSDKVLGRGTKSKVGDLPDAYLSVSDGHVLGRCPSSSSISDTDEEEVEEDDSSHIDSKPQTQRNSNCLQSDTTNNTDIGRRSQGLTRRRRTNNVPSSAAKNIAGDKMSSLGIDLGIRSSSSETLAPTGDIRNSSSSSGSKVRTGFG